MPRARCNQLTGLWRLLGIEITWLQAKGGFGGIKGWIPAAGHSSGANPAHSNLEWGLDSIILPKVGTAT
jgi:hypothetical protein